MKRENFRSSPQSGFLPLTSVGRTSTPGNQDPPRNQLKTSSLCAHCVWPRRTWDQLRLMILLSFSNLQYLLLSVPKYRLRVLTAFSPTYSFWMKLKLILSGLVRSCVTFPHPTIKALQSGVRRDSQATTPPSWCRQGYFLPSMCQLWKPESQNLPYANPYILLLTARALAPSFKNEQRKMNKTFVHLRRKWEIFRFPPTISPGRFGPALSSPVLWWSKPSHTGIYSLLW